MLSWRVRLTVSPENFPLTRYARTCLDPSRPARAVPEKVPSGCSVKFCIGTLDRARETIPDNWPPELVRRTSQSPQRRAPWIALPCTVQVPSASCGAAPVGSTAPTGETTKSSAQAAMSRGRSEPGTMLSPLPAITCELLDLQAPSGLEDDTGAPLAVFARRFI